MKTFIFSILCIITLFCSCSNQELAENASEKKHVKLIKTEITKPTSSRSEVGLNNLKEGYVCTSEESPLQLEVYPSENNMETYSYILDEKGNASHLLKFKSKQLVNPVLQGL